MVDRTGWCSIIMFPNFLSENQLDDITSQVMLPSRLLPSTDQDENGGKSRKPIFLKFFRSDSSAHIAHDQARLPLYDQMVSVPHVAMKLEVDFLLQVDFFSSSRVIYHQETIEVIYTLQLKAGNAVYIKRVCY